MIIVMNEQGGSKMLKKLSVISILIMVVFMAGQLPVYAGDVLNATGQGKDVDLGEKSIVLGMEDGDKVFYLDSSSHQVSAQPGTSSPFRSPRIADASTRVSRYPASQRAAAAGNDKGGCSFKRVRRPKLSALINGLGAPKARYVSSASPMAIDFSVRSV